MVLSAAVVVLVVSALSQIGPASGSYRRTVDRGYVALAQPLVAQSNASGAALGTFLHHASSLGRIAFFSDLDTLAGDTARLQRLYDAITPPDPVTARGCASAMEGRAAGVSSLRSSLEGVLGGPTGLGVIDEAGAQSAMDSAGAALASADASWAACRRALRKAPGSPRMAASVWLRAPGQFDPSAVARLLAAIGGAASLVPLHKLSILAVVTRPPAVASGPTLAVSATTALATDVVLANQGNVDEHGVEVGGVAILAGSAPSAVLVQRTVDLAPARSTTVSLRMLKVQPGSSYTVQVVAQSPHIAGPGAIASRSLAVQVQPAATLTAVTSSPLSALEGRPVSLIADVSSALNALGSPTGTVVFYDDDVAIPGCTAQPVRKGQATCSVTYQSAALHSVTASYSGDARDAQSLSPAITLRVGP